MPSNLSTMYQARPADDAAIKKASACLPDLTQLVLIAPLIDTEVRAPTAHAGAAIAA